MNKSMVLIVGAIIFTIMCAVLFGCSDNARTKTNFIPAEEMTPQQQPTVAIIGIGRTFPQEVIWNTEEELISRGMKIDRSASDVLSSKDTETFPFSSLHRMAKALYLIEKMGVDKVIILSLNAERKPYILWIQEKE